MSASGGTLAQPRVSIEERARRYVAKLDGAMKGHGGHAAGFHAACVLVQGFDLPQDVALAILQDYNLRCSPPFSEKQLKRKVTCAARANGLMTKDGLKPRGCLLETGSSGRDNVGRPIPTRSAEELAAERAAAPMERTEFDPERLKHMAAKWRDVVDLVWLANRSAKDPAQLTSAGFLQALYSLEEKVLCFTNQQSQGQALWPDEKVPSGGPDGVWFLAQPVDGRYHPNPREDTADGKPKLSRRSQESVRHFRYLLLESDKADMRDWLGLIVQIPLRIEAIYTSGGRSIHTLVRVDCPTKSAWDAEKRAMEPTLRLLGIGGADFQALTAVRLTRLPGAMRGSRLQKLLYVNPRASLRALKDAPVLRDVEKYWCGLASLGVGDADEGDGIEWIRRGLGYYRNVSAAVRTAGDLLERQLAEATA